MIAPADLRCPDRRLVALAAGLATAVLASGCTPMLHNHVVARDVWIYRNNAVPNHRAEVPARPAPGRGIPRAEVIRHLGTPVATWTFQPPITARQAATRHIVANDGNYNLSWVADAARIGRIDEFRIRGLIYDGNKFSWEDDFLRETLGLGDLLLFPFTLWDFFREEMRVTPVRVFYYPGDIVLYEALAPDRTLPQLEESLRASD